ncbi:MAG: hypothetical protein ABFR50_00980 [Candidatus Fermentibacteria bacterium]
MKTVLPVLVLSIVVQVMGAVQEGSLYPEDALLISDAVGEYLDGELIVNFAGADSSLVLFISLGGEWTGDPEQWAELIIVSSCAASVDLQRDWSIMDIAVSFGSSWCRVPVNEILELAAEESDESEFLEKFQTVTEFYSMNGDGSN